MSFTKRRLMEDEARGFNSIPDKFVCEGCFDCRDALDGLALQGIVSAHAEEHVCSYCGAQDVLSPVAAPMDAVMEEIMAGIRFQWGPPEEEGVPFESREGGWQLPLLDKEDLVQDLCISSCEELLGDIIQAIRDPQWIECDPFGLPEDKALVYGWQEFSEIVKHKTRYLFLRTRDPEEVRGGGEIPPAEILDRIGGSLLAIDRGLVKDLESGRVVFRVRPQGPGKAYDSVVDLGPPTKEQAVASTRMSPAGIPVFYGALDPETAVQEKLERGAKEPVVLTIGQFEAVRPLRVLDLSLPLPVPSLFDGGRRQLRSATKFLREFVRELAKSVAGDGREHIEYVPTQVAAEYFRQVFRCKDGKPLDGLLYLSSRNPPHAACVLFFGREGCVGPEEEVTEERTREVRLRYLRSSQREVPGGKAMERGEGHGV